MSEGLRGYKILSKQHTAKSVLYFVRRWGRKYVVKEYIDYRFPDRRHGEELSDALKRAEKRTEVYFKHLQKTARLMRRSLRRDGLINIPLDVFRQGRSIYKVSNQLNVCDVEFGRLHEEIGFEKLNVFLRTLLVQLDQLERIGFIHCDLKPENVVVCRRGIGVYSAAIIDCDSGIIIGNDDAHYVDYTPEYAAPEMHSYKRKEAEDEEDADACRARLSSAADMFSAACLMVYCLTGKALDEGMQIPAGVLEAGRVMWVPKMHPVWRAMIRQTLHFDPKRRLHASQFLTVLEYAQKIGLMDELNEPFAGLGEGELIECAKQQVLLQRRGGRHTALWYADELWMTDKDVQSTHILSEHDARVRRSRARVEQICDVVNALCDDQEALFPVQVKEVGSRFFIEQQLPPGKHMRLRDVAEGLPQAQADRFMCALLSAVGALQKKGLSFCLMDIDDIWVVQQTDGSMVPVLSGLHRLVRADELPEREEIDVYPLIAAPEVCLYLGGNDASIREEIASMIGEQSSLFNLGAAYHVLLSGRLPQMTDAEQHLIGEAVWNEYEDMPSVLLDDAIDQEHRELIAEMLCCEPADRPENCRAVIRKIKAVGREKVPQNVNKKEKDFEEDIGWIDVESEGGETEYPSGQTKDSFKDGDSFSQEDELVDAGMTDDELQWEDVTEDGGDEVWQDVPEDGGDEVWEDVPEDSGNGVWEDVPGDSGDGVWKNVSSDDDELRAEDSEQTEEPLEDDEEQREMLTQLSTMIARLAEAKQSNGICEVDEFDEDDDPEDERISVWEGLGEYTLTGGQSFADWHEVECSGGAERAWAHCTGRNAPDDTAQKERLERMIRRTQALAERCDQIMPVECICKVAGERLYSVVKSDQGRFWCMAKETMRSGVDSKLIDEWMRQIVSGVQAVHEDGLLCGVTAAGNAGVPGTELQINIAEHAVIEEDPADMAMWREWMQPWRLEAHEKRSTNMAGAYLSPEAERFLVGEEQMPSKTSDIFSLGVLYHVFWCGQLPAAGSGEGSWNEMLDSGEELKVSRNIPFAQRCLIEKMLSGNPAQRPQSCAKVIAEIDNIMLKRGKTHSVTVKRDGIAVVGKQAWLYTVIDGKEKFVASAVTDRQGKAVFNGYLPEGKYYVRCDGERVTCRWRNF